MRGEEEEEGDEDTAYLADTTSQNELLSVLPVSQLPATAGSVAIVSVAIASVTRRQESKDTGKLRL